MEGPPIFINTVKMASFPKAIQTQCNPHQYSNDTHHRKRKNNLKIHLETQKTLNSQSKLKQKEAMLEVSQYLTSNNNTEPV
jgi:hypothetical protein